MISKLMSCYQMGAILNRKEFLISQITFGVVSLLVFWFYRDYFYGGQIDVSYLISKSILEFSFCVLVLPLFMARLKDMDWSPYFVFFIFPTQLVSA